MFLMTEETAKYMEEVKQNPPNFRNIHDSACICCFHLIQKEKMTLPPFKRYYCELFKNDFFGAETYYYTCDAFISSERTREKYK